MNTNITETKFIRPRRTCAWRGLLAALAALLAGNADADMIILGNGREYEGVLVGAAADTITFRHADGSTKNYPRSDVRHVRLQKLRKWNDCTEASQIPDPLLQSCLAHPVEPRDYPGAGTFLLHSTIAVELRTSQTWSRRERRIVKVLNEHGESAAIAAVRYRKDADKVRVTHGLAIRPDGGVVHLRDTAVQNEEAYADLPRYDTVASRRFALPEGKPGTVLDLETELVREEPVPLFFYSEEFHLGTMEPGRERIVEITAPVSVPIRWQLLNDPEQTVEHTESTASGRVVHTWRRRDLPQLIPEPLMPPLADVVPRLVVSTQTGSWETLAAEFQGVLDRLDREYSRLPEAPAPAPAALWAEVSRHTQANDVALLASGFVPGAPGITWRERRGAALDRTYLLYRWLQANATNGVRWVWIRPRDHGRLATEVPTLQAFSVPALAVGPAPQRQYLIVGDDLTAMAEPAQAYAGATALVAGIGLDKLPVPKPETAGYDLDVQVRLDREGSARVRETTTYRGASARGLRAWRRLTADEIANTVQRRARSIDARATNIRHRIDDVRANVSPLTLVLEYDIPRFADSRPSLCSLRPPWLEFEARAVGRKDRTYPLFWVQPRHDSVSVAITGPDGYELDAGPTEAVCDAGIATLRTSGEQEKNRLRYTVTYSRPGLACPASGYADLKACLETRAGLGRQYWLWRRP